MLQTTGVTESTTNVFSASKGVDTQLTRDGYKQNIAINLEASLSNGAATYYSDAYDRVISSMTLQGGGKIFASIPDMRLLNFRNIFDHGRVFKRPDASQSAATVLANIPYLLDFDTRHSANGCIYPCLDPKYAGDPYIGIPANSDYLNTFVATLNWGAAAAMAAATTTVGAATAARFSSDTVTGWVPPAGNRYYPKWSSETYSITATSTNFAKTFDIPTGPVLRTFIMVLDNTAPTIRDATRVTRVAVITPKNSNAHRWEMTWDELQALTLRQYPHCYDSDLSLVSVNNLAGAMNANTADNGLGYVGVACFDWRKLAVDPATQMLSPLGTQVVTQGDLRIGVNVGTGNGTIIMFHEGLEAY